MPAVPGPPHGRRRRLVCGPASGEAGAQAPAGGWGPGWRVQSARDAEQSNGLGRVALLRVPGDVILLLKDLAIDPRVPRSAKLLAGLVVAYLVSPLDLVPDSVPVIGQVDDLGVVLLAVRWLIRQAGFAVIYESWRGSDEGLALVLTLAGVEE